VRRSVSHALARRAAVLVLATGCSTVHGVRPLGKGAVQVEASLGGPITEVYGAPIPLPISTIGATFGVSDRTDVHAALHPTGLALFGLFAADAGVSYELLPPHGARPRLMADLTLIGAGGGVVADEPAGGFRLFARPTLTGSWDWGKGDRHALYASLGGFVEPWPGVHGFGTIAVGNQWGLPKKTTLTTQVEWIAPYASTTSLTPHYYAPGDLGAISFQLGLAVRARDPHPSGGTP
jgi:hypothetical protein